MRDARCRFEVVSGVPVVTAPDEIDITNAQELRSALMEAAAHGHGTLVVDMTRTTFCDSSGMRTLLAGHKRAQAEGGELLLAITAAPVLRILAITAVDRMIPIFTSLDQALAQTSANGSNGNQRAGRTPPDLPSADRSGRTRSVACHRRPLRDPYPWMQAKLREPTAQTTLVWWSPSATPVSRRPRIGVTNEIHRS